MTQRDTTLDLDEAVTGLGGGRGAMRGLPLSPMLKVALRNLDHAHAHSATEAREAHDLGCGAKALKRLRKLELADVIVEKCTRGTAVVTVRRHFLTPAGIEARRAMDA